jgi:hypothetical protein
MNRSARSTKQNITEGWKRNSTSEYYEFLGYSIASNAELEEDCDDIIKEIYPGLMRIKEVVGEQDVAEFIRCQNTRGEDLNEKTQEDKFSELKGQEKTKGEKGIMGIKGVMGETGTPSTSSTPINPFSSPSSPSSPSTLSTPSSLSTLSTPSSHSTFSSPFSLSEIEKIPFYPLNHNLPPIIQLKLKCKELNYLLARLQKSLEEKMKDEGTISTTDKFLIIKSQKDKEKKFEEEILKKYGIKNRQDD